MNSQDSSYHHLSSQQQLQKLKFDVRLRCIRNGHNATDDSIDSHANNDDSISPIIYKQVIWQERIDAHPCEGNKRHAAHIFTYTNGRGPTKQNESREDRLHGRADSCQTMMIMASISNGNSSSELVLCEIQSYQSGLIVSTPALSVIECEDYDEHGNTFLSNRGMEQILNNGERLTTYTLSTNDGSVYEYSVECSLGQHSRAFDHDLLIDKQSDLDEKVLNRRREAILKDFETSGRLYQDNSDNWSNQAHIEITSAGGFHHPNTLLSMPFGSSLMIKYRLLKPSPIGDGKVVLKGHTDNAQSFSLISCGIEFIVHFTVAFVIILFIMMFALGGIDEDLSLAIVLSIVSLFLILSHTALWNDVQYHFNHQIHILFNTGKLENQDTHIDSNTKITTPKQEKMVLELNAILLLNGGVATPAGCAALDIPTVPGEYAFDVVTWKPIGLSSVGTRRSRMNHYYLGKCLDEISPSKPVPTPANEQEWLKEKNSTLLSKHDLHSDVSGTIRVQVSVSKNHFRRHKLEWSNITADGSGSQSPVFIRETVDEVLHRVRQNKRERMARISTTYDI